MSTTKKTSNAKIKRLQQLRAEGLEIITHLEAHLKAAKDTVSEIEGMIIAKDTQNKKVEIVKVASDWKKLADEALDETEK